jgi:hypothetical protein
LSAPDDLVQVAEAREIYAAELMALRLRSAGIDAQVLDQSFRQEPLPSVRAFAVVRVLVPSDQLEAARRLLEEGRPLAEDWEPGEEGSPEPAADEAAGSSRQETREEEGEP